MDKGWNDCVGSGTTEYTLCVDNRYNVLDPVESLKVGDTFSTETFLGIHNDNFQFTYISNFTILRFALVRNEPSRLNGNEKRQPLKWTPSQVVDKGKTKKVRVQ